MLKFKSFKSGQWTDDDISSFMNSHIIENSRYLENGSIYVFYKEIADAGMLPIDQVERLDKALTLAQREVFDAQQGLEEETANLEATMAKIAETVPNDKEQWDSLQEARKFSEGQITMHKATIEERTKQIANLKQAVSAVEI